MKTPKNTTSIIELPGAYLRELYFVLSFFAVKGIFIFGITTPSYAQAESHNLLKNDQTLLTEDSSEANLVDFNYSSLTDIQVIAERVARINKINIIWDHQIEGKVKIIAPKRVTPEVAYSLFLSSLNMLGLTTVETGKITKILDIKKGIESTPKLFKKNEILPNSDQLVTQLVPLKYVRAKWIVATLSRFSSPGSMIAINQTNTLIISDSSQKVAHVLGIIDFLDVKDQQPRFQTIRIKHGVPSDIAKKINSILAAEEKSKKTSKSRFLGKKGFKILGMDSHGFLAVIGSGALVEKVKKLKDAFDQKTRSQGSGSRIRVYPLEFADAAKISSVINSLTFPAIQNSNGQTKGKKPISMRVSADIESNSLIIVGNKKDYDSVAFIIRKLDKRKIQILIKAEILDIGEQNNFDVGTSIFAGAGGKQNIITGWKAADAASIILAASDTSGSSEGASKFAQGLNDGATLGVLSSQGVSIPGLGSVSPGAFIRLLKADSSTRTLSSPYILTQNNEEASLAVGEILYYRHSIGNGLTPQQPKVEKENVETSIELRAAVNTKNYVSLSVKLDSTQLTGFTEGLPQTNKKKIKQTFIVKSGQTALIAGITNTIESETLNKIPFLGDIPIVGSLFRKKKIAHKRSQLAIFITPYIIHEAKDLLRLYHEKIRENDLDFNFDQTLLFNGSKEHSDETSSG